MGKNHENVSSSIMIPLDHKGIFLFWQKKKSNLKWQFFLFIYLFAKGQLKSEWIYEVSIFQNSNEKRASKY